MENKLFSIYFFFIINSTCKTILLISACPTNCLACDSDHSKCDVNKCATGYYKTGTGACAGKSTSCSL